MPDVKFFNKATAAEKTCTIATSDTLSQARTMLNGFIEDSQAFIDKFGKKCPQDIEDITQLAGFVQNPGSSPATEGVYITAGDEESEFDEDGSDDVNAGGSAGAGRNSNNTPVRDPRQPDLNPSNPGSVRPGDRGDQSPDLGWGGATGSADNVLGLTYDQTKTMLANNRIRMNQDGSATVCAWVLQPSGSLDWASSYGITCTSVDLSPSLGDRYDVASSSFTEFEHEWQQQTIAEASSEGGVPLIFKLNSSYRHVRDGGGFSSGKQVFFQASQHLPKARLVLKGITVNKEFETELRKAVPNRPAAGASKAVEQQAIALMGVLNTWGQFIPLDSIVGGRITLTENMKFTDESVVQKAYDSFKSAASARFSGEGVPAEISGGAGASVSASDRTRIVNQSKALNLTTFGGDAAAATSHRGELGKYWLPTVKWQNWKITGFMPQAVVPVIDLLPADLRGNCIDVLRRYFEQKLTVMNTGCIGNVGETAFADTFTDMSAAYRMRIKRVYFRWARWMDAFRTEWQLDGKTVYQSPNWHGGGRDDSRTNGNGYCELADDEEISELHIRSVALVDSLWFKTTKGTRYPASGYFGGSEANNQPDRVLTAPRIRGFCGNNNKSVDSIGLAYLQLGKDACARDFLLTIEPYLFA